MFLTNIRLRVFVGFISLFGAIQLWAAPIKVVTITEDFASIAHFIGGDLVDVHALVKGSRNLHSVNPKPSMVVKVKKADLLVRLGMSQDKWIDGLIDVAKNSAVFPGKIGYLDCSIPINKLDVPEGQLDGRLGDVHKEGNPHYWLSPYNGIIIAEQIRDRLIALDPDNSDSYHTNFNTFSNKMSQHIMRWKTELHAVDTAEFITYHSVWTYFFDAFQLTSIGQLEPLPGIPPTIAHLSSLKSKALLSPRKKVILSAHYYPSTAGQSFAQSVDGKFVSVSANVDTAHGIDTYFDLFDTIIGAVTQ